MWRPWVVQVLYSHLQHHNDTINRQTHDDKVAGINDARRKTQEDFFNNILPLTLFVRFQKGVTQSLRVRGSWRPNITEIFWPRSYGRLRCLSRSPWLLNRSTGFPYYISSLSAANYTACPQLYSPVSNGSLNSTPLFNSSVLYYLQTPTWWYGHASATSSDI